MPLVQTDSVRVSYIPSTCYERDIFLSPARSLETLACGVEEVI
jgi:hypothetical protein